MEIRLIVNPAAGKARGVAVAERVSRTLRDCGLANAILYSRSPAEPAELAHEAVRARCPLVVGVGGDGLMSQVAGELVGSDTVLGIIPAGVGEVFALALEVALHI